MIEIQKIEKDGEELSESGKEYFFKFEKLNIRRRLDLNMEETNEINWSYQDAFNARKFLLSTALTSNSGNFTVFISEVFCVTKFSENSMFFYKSEEETIDGSEIERVTRLYLTRLE